MGRLKRIRRRRPLLQPRTAMEDPTLGAVLLVLGVLALLIDARSEAASAGAPLALSAAW